MALNRDSDPAAAISPVLKEDQLLNLQQAANSVKIDAQIMQYIASLVQATRTHKKLRLGASPRGSIALMKASQALALIQGSDFVTAHMVQTLVKPVLAHRLLSRGTNDGVDSVLEDILKAIPVPSMPSHLKSDTGNPAIAEPALSS